MAAADSTVIVESRPHPVHIDTRRTAVIVVDMQNDFGADAGMFARAGIDISGIRAAIDPTARVLTAARRAGIPVVFLKMAFRPDLSDAGAPDAPNWLKHLPFGVGDPTTAPDGAPSRILIRDMWNTDIVPELAPHPDDIVVYKHRFSGFYETELDAILRGRSIDSLIVTGCTTSVCIEATVRDAMYRDYRCVVLEDCTAEPVGSGFSRSNHDASVLLIEMLFGWVSTSATLISALAL